jgi:hypothetical protein
MRLTRAEAFPKKGKPVSSLFPAGFQPPETKPFQWLAPQSPTPAISRRFTPTAGVGAGTEAAGISRARPGS